MTARNREATAVVLETFQTYYAFSDAVNQGFLTATQGVPVLNPPRRGANAQHAAPVGFATIFSAQRHQSVRIP